MKSYDLIIIGAGTSGAYLAQRMARRGHKVLVIEQLSRAKVGTKYDIFHIERREFDRLDIPRPVEGDPAWAFEFEKNYNADPLTLYPKCQTNPIVGLHMHEYTLLLCDRAEETGAEIKFGCAFEDFLYDDSGKICGVTAKQRGRQVSFGARIVADCSGMAAVGRLKLPDGYGVENTPLTDEDMFYVILRYVTIKNPEDYLDGSTFWAAYKAWIAPCADPHGAIIGIGACHSFEYAEQIYAEMESVVPLPEHEVVRIERGRTPYTRNVYSMVADNFFVSGDAGNLTKSVNGEGVTSAMVQLKLGTEVLDRALKLGDTSRKAMWAVNRYYNMTQGAEFAMLRALLVGVVNAVNFDEFQYVFESGIISDELLNALSGQSVPPQALLAAAKGFVTGIAKKKLRTSTIKAAVLALKNAVEIMTHYKRFPETEDGFGQWCAKADAIYEKIGKIK
jgi:flavin-dependent dehydrogenase